MNTPNIDTLNMGRAIWRNRLALIPVLILTMLGIGWAIFLMPKVYQVESSLLILPPPAAPSQETINRFPELAKLNTDNPYARRYDPTILITLVSIDITSPPSRAAIRDAGGDERFTVVQASTYGFGSPFADITSTASSAKEAVTSNELVIKAFQKALIKLQAKDDTSPQYYVTIREAGDPSTAKVNATASAKVVIQIIGLGVFGIFAAVSVSDALRESRRERREGGGIIGGRAAEEPEPSLMRL